MSLAGEGAGVVDEEGAAAEEPSQGDGPDQKPSGSCKVQSTKLLFLFHLTLYPAACMSMQFSTVLIIADK